MSRRPTVATAPIALAAATVLVAGCGSSSCESTTKASTLGVAKAVLSE